MKEQKYENILQLMNKDQWSSLAQLMIYDL